MENVGWWRLLCLRLLPWRWPLSYTPLLFKNGTYLLEKHFFSFHSQSTMSAKAKGTDLPHGPICSSTQHHRSNALTAGADTAFATARQKESVLPTPWGLLLGLWAKGEVSSSHDPHKTLQPQRCFPKFCPTRSASCFLACSITGSLMQAQVDHDGMVQVQSGKMGRKLSERRKDWNEASNDAVSMATTLLHTVLIHFFRQPFQDVQGTTQQLHISYF